MELKGKPPAEQELLIRIHDVHDMLAPLSRASAAAPPGVTLRARKERQRPSGA